MPDFTGKSKEELRADLTKYEELIVDVQEERSFMAKQANMHIHAADFERLDQDKERFEGYVEEIKKLLGE